LKNFLPTIDSKIKYSRSCLRWRDSQSRAALNGLYR